MLQALRDRVAGKRAVILGVGNPLRGDDGAGPDLIARLQGRVAALLIDAGDVPENYLGPVTAARPDVVVIVDAADLGAAPGVAAVVEMADIGVAVPSTHTISLAVLARAIQLDARADVFLLGIQPSDTAFGASISPPVAATIELLQGLLERCWPPGQAIAGEP